MNNFYIGYRWSYYLTHPWVLFTDFYRQCKYVVQRGFNGYADCDAWSIDTYLNKWMPEAIRELKAGMHGTPMPPKEVYDLKEDQQYNDIPKEVWEKWHVEWLGILDKIARGFEADRRTEDMVYWDNTELPYDYYDPKNIELREAKKEGLELFIKYYDSLWN